MTSGASWQPRKAATMGPWTSEGGRVLRFPGRPGSERLVTKAELAAHLQVHEKTIERRMASGMPCLRVGKRAVRFRISECEAWLEAQA